MQFNKSAMLLSNQLKLSRVKGLESEKYFNKSLIW